MNSAIDPEFGEPSEGSVTTFMPDVVAEEAGMNRLVCCPGEVMMVVRRGCLMGVLGVEKEVRVEVRLVRSLMHCGRVRLCRRERMSDCRRTWEVLISLNCMILRIS